MSFKELQADYFDACLKLGKAQDRYAANLADEKGLAEAREHYYKCRDAYFKVINAIKHSDPA